MLHQLRQRLVRLDSLGAAAQNAGVAAFNGQRSGFNRHVGPAFVNHAENANRHAHLPDANAAGLLLHADDFANHVRHGGQLFAAKGNRGNVFGAELEAVQQRRGQAVLAGAVQITLVGDLQRGNVQAQQAGQFQQSRVFNRSRCPGHFGRSHFCFETQAVHQLGNDAGLRQR